jgi:hypothetical protein
MDELREEQSGRASPILSVMPETKIPIWRRSYALQPAQQPKPHIREVIWAIDLAIRARTHQTTPRRDTLGS